MQLVVISGKLDLTRMLNLSVNQGATGRPTIYTRNFIDYFATIPLVRALSTSMMPSAIAEW